MSDQTRAVVQGQALRLIAAAAVRARQRASAQGIMPPFVGTEFLCDVEHALASLIVLDAIPTLEVPRHEAHPDQTPPQLPPPT